MADEMLQLFRSHYEQPDSPDKLGLPQGHVDYWKLEATSTREPNLSDPDAKYPLMRGWMKHSCSVCGDPEVVSWDQADGYRCERHRI